MSTYDYNTYSTVDSSAVGAVVGGVFLIVGIVLLITLAIVLCSIIGQWKAFKKAGKGGWEAIIPIYNSVVLCQITGVNPWWVLIVFAGSFLFGLLSAIPVIGVLFSLASWAITIYFSVILYVSAARSFGKSDGFAAGLYFLGPIFWLILGSKNTQYVGPKPMNDVVMNFVNEKILNKQPQTGNVNTDFASTDVQNNQAQPAKFCTGCGYKITNNERFCPACGKEVQ